MTMSKIKVHLGIVSLVPKLRIVDHVWKLDRVELRYFMSRLGSVGLGWCEFE